MLSISRWMILREHLDYLLEFVRIKYFWPDCFTPCAIALLAAGPIVEVGLIKLFCMEFNRHFANVKEKGSAL